MELTANKSIRAFLDESLHWRYATKKFDTAKKLSDDKIEQFFEVLRLSASSMGLQPYHFFWIENNELRKELRNFSYDQSQITDASGVMLFTAKTKLESDEIAAFVKMEGETRGYREDAIQKRIQSVQKYVDSKTQDEFFEWSARQAYIAIGNLLSAAALLRVDACPMEGIKAREYDRILGLEPLNLKSLAVVTLGYRSSEDSYQHKAKVRKPLDDLISRL
jgi:nitroreductase